jgi:hypothetical protein
MSRQRGYVYAIQMDGHPIYKLGRSKNALRRTSDIGVQLPFPYKIIFTRKLNDPVQVETVLHQAFRELRTNGEWFRLSSEQVSFIDIMLLIHQCQELVDALIESIYSKHCSDPHFDCCAARRHAWVLHRATLRLHRRQRLLRTPANCPASASNILEAMEPVQ